MLTLISPSQNVNSLSGDAHVPAPARAVNTITF